MEAGEGSDAAVAAVAGAAESDEERTKSKDEALLSRAHKLISKITATQQNPSPKLIHALASMLEAQESRYRQESTSFSSNNDRASHTIGKLGNLVRDNDEFYELITSKFLSENGYSVTIRAAAARLLFSLPSTWTYRHIFDDAVLANTKIWIMEDSVKVPGDEYDWKHELGINKSTDSEMLRTYATGLLAISLAGRSQVVDNILTSGLSVKLMRYLRTRVLGEVNVCHNDASFSAETKHASMASSMGGREENRGRPGHRDRDRNISIKQAHGRECCGDVGESLKSELTDSLSEVGLYDMVEEDADLTGDGWEDADLTGDRWEDADLTGDRWYGDGHVSGRSTQDEGADENARDDSSRRRVNRGWPRTREKGKISEVNLENERTLTSPCSWLRLGGLGRGCRDRSVSKNEDTKIVLGEKRSRINLDGIDLGEYDDRFRDCKIGSRDITDMVKKAVLAAEAEAQAANAPAEAIEAASDAVAEFVKTAALEAWKRTNDEEAAVLAASDAASTVVDAAIETEISRNPSYVGVKSIRLEAVESGTDEEFEEFFILDDEPLAQLREEYSLECLGILGEYVEALGPILHEKGVDVCLALLQRSLKDEQTNNVALMPLVLKLICDLAAHRTFAESFVDKGGIETLLSIRRVPYTFFGLSSCLFTIGSLQETMERVCTLPSDVVHQVVELALQLLECPLEPARKNAAIFFAAVFVFRAVLDSFDEHEGLHIMLNLLHGAASVRSGGNSGIGIPSATLRNNRSPAKVLSALEKQIAYHTCVALRQYFRVHLLLLMDSLRQNKSSLGIARSTPSSRSAYKPLDISNEAMDAVFLQIQRDRKLGPAFMKAPWPVVDEFLTSKGHITMLELCQAPPIERYLHDLAQYAFGVLYIVAFVPYSHTLIVNATLSNDRVGMSVILNAANGAGNVDPEVIHAALNVLVNLVCPPPSITNKPSVFAQGQQPISVPTVNGPIPEIKERSSERNISDHTVPFHIQNELRECKGETNPAERGGAAAFSTPFRDSSSQTAMPAMSRGIGPVASCADLAAQLERGYRQAREAIRASNGIRVLLHLLNPRMITALATHARLRALACRVLLGLARDNTIAHILRELQVAKTLLELIQDSGRQAGTEQGRWQSELAQVAIKLITIVANSGCASTLAATDAAAPALRRIERSAIAAATPITYHSRELLLLIHEHLQASGLTNTAALLQREADLTPLTSLATPPSPLHQTSSQEISPAKLQWPSGRASCGFLSDTLYTFPREEDFGVESDSDLTLSKKEPLIFSCKSQGKGQLPSHLSFVNTISVALKSASTPSGGPETPSVSVIKSRADLVPPLRTPIQLPMKRKLMDSKDTSSASPAKRLTAAENASQSLGYQTPTPGRRNCLPMDPTRLSSTANCTPQDHSRRTPSRSVFMDNLDVTQHQNTPRATSTTVSQLCLPSEPQPVNVERMTLDSLVVQYMKHQHRNCPAPITTLPPLSLLHPHVCPEPSRSLNAPANVAARVSTREFRKGYGGIPASRKNREFVYSRFKPLRTYRDDASILTCLTFLGRSALIATGSHSGELKIFDSNNMNVLESHSCHQTPVTLVQSALSGETQMVLSSGTYDVRLWDSSALSSGPLHSFERCKAARFSHSGTMFASISTETSCHEVLLYDIQTCNVLVRLSDSSNRSSGSVREHTQPVVYFSPLDTMLLWNGVLWDRRSSSPVHQFDQLTDYGGGGFHPAGNEVIVNSEVWDLRKFKLLRSVPSLDQTVITFNPGGDVIYAILRRNIGDITSAVSTRRARHPLFSAFRTIDAVNYSDIATTAVDRCVLGLAADSTDSFVGVVVMNDEAMFSSSARIYEIGRRRPTDDDSDPDDGANTDEDDSDEENDESEANMDGSGDLDIESDVMGNDDDDDEDADFEVGQRLLEITTEGEDGERDGS